MLESCGWDSYSGGCGHPINDDHWLAVDGGYSKNIALKNDGSLWIWNQMSNSWPNLVQVGQDYDWMAVSTGMEHNLALKQDGSLWAWGEIIGSARGRYSPMQVGEEHDWAMATAGYGSSYALKQDGSLWAWKGNNFDQLSDGTAWETEPARIIGPDFYTVTPSAGSGGSISPDTPQSVEHGKTTDFEVTPATGYSIDKVEGCGGTLDASTGIYTTGLITADCTVTATFVSSITYTVTPQARKNGSITPDTPQQVPQGTTASFIVTPDAGYTIKSVSGCRGSLNGDNYTTGPITRNCRVTASFKKNPVVTARAGSHGSIDPAGRQSVSKGTVLSFTVTPDVGYSIKRVVGCGGSLDGSTYTTGSITKKCVVSALFSRSR